MSRASRGGSPGSFHTYVLNESQFAFATSAAAIFEIKHRLAIYVFFKSVGETFQDVQISRRVVEFCSWLCVGCVWDRWWCAFSLARSWMLWFSWC